MALRAAANDGIRTFGAEPMEEPVQVAVAGGTALAYSRRAPNKESPNEDRAAIVALGRGNAVLLVADGAGGMPQGAEASTRAVESAAVAIGQSVQEGKALRDAILNGIEAANRAVLKLNGAASTIAAVKIQGSEIRPFHVGDSEILVTGQRGRTKLQTISHSPVGYAVESGILDAAEAVHHEDRHYVSNLLGMAEMRIDIGPKVSLAARDTVVIASDGLFDNFYSAEIVECVRKGSLPTAAEYLAEEGRRRMQREGGDHPAKPDDLTFVLFRRNAPKTRRASSD